MTAKKQPLPTPMANIVGNILDKLVPIFRDNAGSFATDLARDAVALLAYLERKEEVCFWSAYESGTSIRLDPKKDAHCLWYSASSDKPLDVYEINLRHGSVRKLKHISRSFHDDGVSV